MTRSIKLKFNAQITLVIFLTSTKLLNMTVKRMNHSKYLCSTRHLILHRNFSHLKCKRDDIENIQHSGRQSSTSTMYFLGILFDDWSSQVITCAPPEIINILSVTRNNLESSFFLNCKILRNNNVELFQYTDQSLPTDHKPSVVILKKSPTKVSLLKSALWKFSMGEIKSSI